MHDITTERDPASGPAYAWQVASCSICGRRTESRGWDSSMDPRPHEAAEREAIERLQREPCSRV